MMFILILQITVPFAAIVGFVVGKRFLRWKYPVPTALGRVLPKLCVVDSDEMFQYNETVEEQCELTPHLAAALRENQIQINLAYLKQMGSNTLLFQQVVRFEKLKIARIKSSFEYEPREILVVNLIDEFGELRSEILRAKIDLKIKSLLRHTMDGTRIQDLLVRYKCMEHDMIELAGMANDTTCRDMLIERLGLIRWKIIPGGGSQPAPA